MPVQDADADMGKAYMDITAAEQQATLIEEQLRALESKLGAFLDEHDTLDTAAGGIPRGGDSNGTITNSSAKEDGA